MKDPIYLLSIEEYEKYTDKIPYVPCWWWLRSSGYAPYYATAVYDGDFVGRYGYHIKDACGAVRPVIKIDTTESNSIVFYNITWIKIDTYLYIAENPIGYRRFDSTSNNYETSEIRKFLLNWYKELTK